MLYNSTVVLIQGCTNINAKYGPTIHDGLKMTVPNGYLDVYLMKSPPTLMAVESIIRQIYELCRHEASKLEKSNVFITVLLDGRDYEQTREQSWECIVTGNREANNATEFRKLTPDISDVQKLPVVIVPMREEYDDEIIEDPKEEEENDTPDHHKLLYTKHCEQNVVAVGGTFDHLHDGHKLLLTLAGYLARESLIVGITGPELLKNKKYAQAMQSYARRKQSVENLMNYIFPVLKVDCYLMNDIYGPTAEVENIDALVVSSETRSGGDAVNKLRREEKNWHELKIFEVDLIGGSSGSKDKLSSTELRRLELETVP